MTATYQINFTEDFFLAAYQKYRRHSAMHRCLLPVAVAILMVIGGLHALRGYRTGIWQDMISPLVLGVGVFAAMKLRTTMIRYYFNKSPYKDDQLTITLTDNGFLASGTKQRVELTWDAFSNAICFDDGILLFQGPSMYNWLPDSALDGDIIPNDVCALIRIVIPSMKNC